MTAQSKKLDLATMISRLQDFKIGGSCKGPSIARKDLVRILHNLSTLTSNGVSIPVALETICNDPTFRKNREILRDLTVTVRAGGSLSSAMKKFPSAFSALLVNQIQVGEQAGNLPVSLQRLVHQLENASKIKSYILKKLSYPMVVVVAGSGCVTFMLTSVIPTFQKMYEESGAVLPWITQFWINISSFMIGNGLVLSLGFGGALAGIIYSYMNPISRKWIDRNLLNVPLLGGWLKNLAVLQFVETLGSLLESGFNLVDALPAAAKSVENRYMRERLLDMHAAIRRGERFSVAMSKEEGLFPPVVSQLVVVGEKTGRLVSVSREIRDHMENEIEKLTNALLGAIEPLLTIGLACAIGGILLAVYLPMFDMIGNVKN
ncbi:MAG: type II secretion system F family protein [Planctomycetales bacterium]|nr:type II secretion system F family protein [Planctomycetales bacterium]